MGKAQKGAEQGVPLQKRRVRPIIRAKEMFSDTTDFVFSAKRKSFPSTGDVFVPTVGTYVSSVGMYVSSAGTYVSSVGT